LLAYAAKRHEIWLNDRELCVVQGCNLFSGTILSPPMLARLLIGSPETVLSALTSAMSSR
jgi:hypothetical protein